MQKTSKPKKLEPPSKMVVVEEHLPPLGLVFVVLACSGVLWMFGLRDVLATGRIIGGAWDHSMLLFTKSTSFYDDSHGWRSTQGGLSTIQQVTTDANNMGGLFVRKVGGAAVVAVQTQKLIPLLFHPFAAEWKKGHFTPFLWTALVGNLATIAFYMAYLQDLTAANAGDFGKLVLGVLLVESVVLFYFLALFRPVKPSHAVAMPLGKSPSSIVSRIVARTVLIVTTTTTIIAGRDLLFPGKILGFLPRDDVYLEWTNALLHSPPEGTPEAVDQGLESPLYVADKFLSQLMALHLLILCLYKFVSAFMIRYGSDGSGEIKCKMIWKAQAIGGALIVFLIRLFTPAAKSASLDLRWHLMCLGYETFILGLCGFL